MKEFLNRLAVVLGLAGVFVGAGASANAGIVMMSTDGIGYINPAHVGSSFIPADLKTVIDLYNGTLATPPSGFHPVVGTSVPAAPLGYPANNNWYTIDPGGNSVDFTASTLGANGLGLPNNTAIATLNVPAGTLYLVAQWDGGSSTGNNSIYYLGGASGQITLVNDMKNYIGGNASQQALSHFYLVSSPVPEPTTMIAGALLLLPFGLSAVRILRKKS